MIKNTKAAIALISLLIIATVSLIMAFGMSEINISTSIQSLNADINKKLYYMAEACLEESILRLEKNNIFEQTTINFSADSYCTVNATGASTKDITVQAVSGDYIQHFTARLNLVAVGTVYNARLLYWLKI